MPTGLLINMAKKWFIAQSGQSLSDLALMAYGDPLREFDLIKENPQLSRTATTYAGIQIFYTPPANSPVYNQLGTTKIVFATSSIKVGECNYLLQENSFDFLLEDNSGKIKLEN